MRGWLVLSGLAGAAGVALGAYAAHGLGADSYGQGLAERASAYLLLHALALLAVVALRQQGIVSRLAALACLLFGVGMVLFCGSLTWRVFVGTPLPVPMLTPLGGMSFLFGWVMVAVSAIYRKSCGRSHGSV